MCAGFVAASLGAASEAYGGRMARQLRSLLPDGTFHVTARTVAGDRLYRDDADFLRFLSFLGDAKRRFEWTTHAYCLMTTHYHLVLGSTRVALSDGLHCLNGAYARTFNDRYGRRGHVFGARFACWVVDSEEYIYDACRYVLLNPVRAGLVDRAEAWPWSDSRFGRRAD